MPRVIWLITALHGLLLFMYSVVVPAYRAPDEAGHVDLALKARSSYGYPNYDEGFVSQQVSASRSLMRYDRRSQGLTAEEATPRSQRPPFNDIAPTEAETDARNFLANHPPLYYAVLGAVTTLIVGVTPTEWPFDRVVGLLRVLNILLVVWLPVIAFGVVRRLGWSPTVGIAAALVPLSIPMLTNIGSTVNNDNGLTLLASLVILLLAGVAAGDASRRTALLLGLVGGLALLTKGFALALPVWLGAGYATLRMAGHSWAVAVRRFGLALAVALLLGGWWWARNILVFDAIQTGSDLDWRPLAPASFDPDLGYWLGRYASWMLDRFWGSFGRVDITFPWGIILSATVVLGIGLAAAFVFGARPRSRWHLVMLLTPLVTILGILTYGAWDAYVRLGQPVGFHGRYLFPGVVGLSVVAAVGFGRTLRRWEAALPVLVLVFAATMHVAALRLIVPFYWGAPDATLPQRLRAVLAWSPWPPAMVVLVMGLVVLTSVVLAVWLANGLRKPWGHSPAETTELKQRGSPAMAAERTDPTNATRREDLDPV